MKTLLLFICFCFLIFAAEAAETPPLSPSAPVILGQIQYLTGNAWLVNQNGIYRKAGHGMKIYAGDSLKAFDKTWIRLLNGNQMELLPGALAEFSSQGIIYMHKGESKINLVNGRNLILKEGVRISLEMLPTLFQQMTEVNCNQIMAFDFLKLFILAKGFEGELADGYKNFPADELYLIMNELLHKNNLASFPSDTPFACLGRDFFIKYFYALLAEKFDWEHTAIIDEKRIALTRQGYLNPAFAEEGCVCRSEAVNMLWDAFFNMSSNIAQDMSFVMADITADVGREYMDPFVTPFPNLYEEPISPSR
jgi:hypothetical protein